MSLEKSNPTRARGRFELVGGPLDGMEFGMKAAPLTVRVMQRERPAEVNVYRMSVGQRYRYVKTVMDSG